MQDGYVKGGENLERNWPGYSSFFINQGCVCVINKAAYRVDMPESNVEFNASKFPFFSSNFILNYYGNNPVFLIFNDIIEKDLLSWKLWKEQEKFGEKCVPYYEAGYKGNIPLSKIDKAIILDLAIPEGNGITAELAAARKKGMLTEHINILKLFHSQMEKLRSNQRIFGGYEIGIPR